MEELYYLSSENKGANQLCSYCEADLHLCFRLCSLLVFPWGGSYFSYFEKIGNFHQEFFLYFSYFCTKHRLWDVLELPRRLPTIYVLEQK